MWTRQELKHRGKKAFYGSYWKFVLVSLVLTIVVGTASGASSGFSSSMSNIASQFNQKQDYVLDDFDLDDFELNDDELAGIDLDDYISIEDGKVVVDKEGLKEAAKEAANEDNPFDNIAIDSDNVSITVGENSFEFDKSTAAAIGIGIAIAFIVLSIIMCIIGIVGICVDIFVYNPIEYGCQKFLKKSLDEKTSLATMFHGFKDGYRNIVKVMFFRDLFIFLWSLLFVIPGIVKSYAYRLVPYILAENPGISKDEALKESHRLMMGNKWRTFVLDLSFLGWYLLSAMTFGLLGIFYVNPYKNGTNAALYEALKEEKGSNVCLTES